MSIVDLTESAAVHMVLIDDPESLAAKFGHVYAVLIGPYQEPLGAVDGQGMWDEVRDYPFDLRAVEIASEDLKIT